MRRLPAGISRGSRDVELTSPSAANDRWAEIIRVLSRGRSLRPVQCLAIEARIHESRQHLVVCAPPNSGKSLIGHLVLLDAVLQGRLGILVEPLRALAQEQTEELTDLFRGLVPGVLPRPPKIRISTGDYRLDDELPFSAPPDQGEVVVVTPERLDGILRNPAHMPWASSVGSLVVDEAHLLGDPRRGPTVELLIASMLSLSTPPRVALLSATIGEPERLREWLKPCQLLTSSSRTPLRKEVWQLDVNEEPDDLLADELRSILSEPRAAVVVFVYRRNGAEALSKKLSSVLNTTVQPYHSGQAAADRRRIRGDFIAGLCRCLVSTTALAMGVNLPATHVFVRDTTFFGFGRLRSDELLQILGRAGRGDRAGVGAVLLRSGDDWSGEELAGALRDEVLPPIRSSFEVGLNQRRSPEGQCQLDLAAAVLVATCLARTNENGLTEQELSRVLGNTLGGKALISRLGAAITWLTDPCRLIAYRDEQKHLLLTVLGVAGVRSMLPLTYVAGLGQLVRDLMSLDPTAKLLGRWSALDHLFVTSLLSDRVPKLRRFSEDLAERIDGWVESQRSDEKSLLFSHWVMGTSAASKVDELLGSLGTLQPGETKTQAWKRAYVAMLSALVLDERSRGVPLSDIENRWSLSGVEGIEESWRDSALWLLAGHTSVFEIRAFYHHLRENCSATPDSLRDTKRALARIRHRAYDLLDRLKYCSPLGPLMRGIRDTSARTKGPKIGLGTIQKLEAAGITTLQQVAQLDLEALVAAGIQKRFAKQIRTYVQRRLR